MRSEKEMYDLILDIAKRDERIRAVYMNGSRVILENQLFFKNQINWIKCKELILTLIMDILI